MKMQKYCAIAYKEPKCFDFGGQWEVVTYIYEPGGEYLIAVFEISSDSRRLFRVNVMEEARERARSFARRLQYNTQRGEWLLDGEPFKKIHSRTEKP
tara:strand:- start:217 stop:507 length:291 start_codon:yes stop_codon:yes gene_type:complete